MFCRSASSPSSSMSPSTDDAPRGRLQRQHRKRRPHRGGGGVVALIQQQRFAAGDRDAPARAAPADRREAGQRRGGASGCRARAQRPPPAPRPRSCAICRPGAAMRNSHPHAADQRADVVDRPRPPTASSNRASAFAAPRRTAAWRRRAGSRAQQRRIGRQHRGAARLQPAGYGSFLVGDGFDAAKMAEMRALDRRDDRHMRPRRGGPAARFRRDGSCRSRSPRTPRRRGMRASVSGTPQ